MSEIQIPKIKAEVELLIGNNAPKAIEPWEIINSRENGPYAVKTLLGWVINGPLDDGVMTDSNGRQNVTVNRISVAKLEDLLVQQYNHDFNETLDDKEMSVEDKRFIKIAEQSITPKDGHYSIDLPFRSERPVMPNNTQTHTHTAHITQKQTHTQTDTHTDTHAQTHTHTHTHTHTQTQTQNFECVTSIMVLSIMHNL